MMDTRENDMEAGVADETADAAPARRRLASRVLRMIATVVLFVVAIAGVELAVGGATAVAHEFGYTGNVAQMARLMSFGLYAVIILAVAKRR